MPDKIMHKTVPATGHPRLETSNAVTSVPGWSSSLQGRAVALFASFAA